MNCDPQYDVCVTSAQLAVPGRDLKHLQVFAVGGHSQVRILGSKELHLQHLVCVSTKLEEIMNYVDM